MLKLQMLELVAIEGKLRSEFETEPFIEDVAVKSVQDKRCLPHEWLCYIHLRVKEWNEDIEERVIQIFRKCFKIDVSFWANHRMLSQAEKVLKSSTNLALLIEHPNQEGNGSYLTTYLLDR